MARDAVSILDRAVKIVRAAGRDVAGWTMQSSADGYVAWLYREDDDGQWPLFEDVDVRDTAVAAAESCLVRATEEEEDEDADEPDADDADGAGADDDAEE